MSIILIDKLNFIFTVFVVYAMFVHRILKWGVKAFDSSAIRALGRLHTHTPGFCRSRTGIAAAGGQFDFERCVGFIQTGVFKTVVRHRQVQIRVKVPMQLHWNWLAGPRLVEFQSGTLICRTGNSAWPAACENTHLFTLHPAPDSDPSPVLPVCVQTPLWCLNEVF